MAGYCGTRTPHNKKRNPNPLWMVLLIPIVLPLAIYGFAQEGAETLRYKLARREARKRHTWLPRRSLSDLDLSRLPKKQSSVLENNRNTSSFLAKLPLEVRELIYRAYFYDGEGTSVITVCEQRKQEYVYGYEYAAFITREHDREKIERGNRLQRRGERVRSWLLDLPLTCRQIYAESITTLYTTPTFRVDTYPDALLLPHMFLPHRFQALRSLEIDLSFDSLPTLAVQEWQAGIKRNQWPDLCTTLATLPRLEKLRVHLKLQYISGGFGGIIKNSDWAPIFEPLVKFQESGVVRDFEVKVERLTGAAREVVERLGLRVVCVEKEDRWVGY